MAKVIQVIYVERVIGAGTQEDPSREVKELWTFDGELICVLDPIDEGRSRELRL